MVKVDGVRHGRLVVVAAVIEQDGSLLVTRRIEGTHLAGLWEFPGGKIASGESHRQGLAREIREELDVDVDIGALVFETQHDYAERTVSLHFYRCTLRGTPRPVLGQEMQWVPRAELQSLDFPPADAELIGRLTTSAPARDSEFRSQNAGRRGTRRQDA